MLDAITLFVLSITIVIGVLRGFIKEIFGLCGIIISFIVTYYKHGILVDSLGIKSELIANVVSTSVLYVMVIVTISVINGCIMYMLSGIRLTPVDRILGVLSGALKGLLLSFFFFMYMQLVYYTLSDERERKDVDKILPVWMTSSKVYKPFRYIQTNVDEVLPESWYEDIKDFGGKLHDLISENNNDKASKKAKEGED